MVALWFLMFWLLSWFLTTISLNWMYIFPPTTQTFLTLNLMFSLITFIPMLSRLQRNAWSTRAGPWPFWLSWSYSQWCLSQLAWSTPSCRTELREHPEIQRSVSTASLTLMTSVTPQWLTCQSWTGETGQQIPSPKHWIQCWTGQCGLTGSVWSRFHLSSHSCTKGTKRNLVTVVADLFKNIFHLHRHLWNHMSHIKYEHLDQITLRLWARTFSF